jgi:hypothetical protein
MLHGLRLKPPPPRTRARYIPAVTLWQRFLPRRPRAIDRLSDLLATSRDELVTLHGRVEPLDPIFDPVSGEAAVAIDYRAAPQSSVVGVAGALSIVARAFHVSCQQATDFIVTDGPHRVLVCVDRGADVVAVHRDLVARYGVGLHTDRSLVRPDAAVRVIGRRVGTLATSPLRDEPYLAVIRAQRFWLSDA